MRKSGRSAETNHNLVSGTVQESILAPSHSDTQSTKHVSCVISRMAAIIGSYCEPNMVSIRLICDIALLARERGSTNFLFASLAASAPTLSYLHPKIRRKGAQPKPITVQHAPNGRGCHRFYRCNRRNHCRSRRPTRSHYCWHWAKTTNTHTKNLAYLEMH